MQPSLRTDRRHRLNRKWGGVAGWLALGACLALPLQALAWTAVYDPAFQNPVAPQEFNDLQAAFDLLAGTPGGCNDCQGIELRGDWNGDLVYASVRGEDFVVDASGSDWRIARTLTVEDSELPLNVTTEGRIHYIGGWVGLPDGSGDVLLTAPVQLGAANLEFVGTAFRGHDWMSLQGGVCQRVGAGGLVAIEGHATTDRHNDLNHSITGDHVLGSIDLIDCLFDFRFSAAPGCDAADGAVPQALYAHDAKLRMVNPILPAGACRRFQNSFLQAEESLVHLADTDLADIQIVAGGTAAHAAPLLVATGTLLDGGDDPNTPAQVKLLGVELSDGFGGDAGAVWIESVDDSGDDYGGVWIGGVSRFSGCSGTLTGAVHVWKSTLSSVAYTDFDGNQSDATGDAGAGALAIVDQQGAAVPVHDCVFTDNGAGSDAAPGALLAKNAGLQLHDSRVEGSTGRAVRVASTSAVTLQIENVAIVDGAASSHAFGLSLDLPGRPGNVLRNVLVSGVTRGVELELGGGDAGSELLLDGLTVDGWFSGFDVDACSSSLRIVNTNIVSGVGLDFIDSNADQLTLDHVNFDGAATQVAGPGSPASSQVTAFASDFVGVGDAVEAHQLKWSSPLLDIGVSTGALELQDHDFDLTARDIGHKRRFPVVDVTGATLINPALGWYRMDAQSRARLEYDGALPHGTVIRGEEGVELDIVCGAAGGVFHLGDSDGERTAIVPRGEDDAFDRALWLGFAGENGEELQFHGVLFNGIADELRFSNCEVELDFNTGPAVHEFRDVQDLQDDTPTSMSFTDCAGEVRSFDFRRDGFGTWSLNHLSTLRSSVSVRECVFDLPDAVAGYSLAMEGRLAGVAATIADCEFDGGSLSGYPIKLIDSQPRLEGNTVANIQNVGLHSYLGAPTLNDFARNRFLSMTELPDLNLLRLVFLHDSPTWFECGENSFVYDEVITEPTFDFVFYKGKQPIPLPGAPDVSNYTRNFWGSSCSQAVSTTGRIPSWAVPGIELPGCPNPLLPPASCVTGGTPIEMLSSGGELETAGDLTLAAATYEDLIVAYPDSPEARSAAQRLKSIAFDGRLDLQPDDFAALADAVSESASLLPAYLDGAAELLRAWQGDGASAAANLDAAYENAADESEAALAAKNRLEIETYPAGGQLARAAGRAPEAARRRAEAALLAFDPEAAAAGRFGDCGASVRPGGLDLLGAWPNPFNPSTTLALRLAQPAPLTVSVFNLAGQRVAVLRDGPAEAGEHRLTWTAGAEASGVYLLRASTPTSSVQRKVLLIK